MKNKYALIGIIAFVVVIAVIVIIACSCNCGKGNKDSDAKQAATAEVISKGKGAVYVEDNFETISPTEKTTDKDGNTVISYTNAQGQKVTRTYKKDGTIRVVIKDKKGNVIKDKTMKNKETTKKPSKKDDKKKDDKKKDDKKDEGEHAGVVNNEDGWSDFY